eukprot:Nk52_evm29s295 gene=Nk52_evmTU29s295
MISVNFRAALKTLILLFMVVNVFLECSRSRVSAYRFKPKETDHKSLHQIIADHGKAKNSAPTTPYHSKIAYALGKFSSVSYCSAEDITKWDKSCPRCSIEGLGSDYKTVKILSDKVRDLQGFVGVGTLLGTKAIIVSFRGTIANDYTEWLNNLRYSKAKIEIKGHPGVAVHSGFYDDYHSQIRKQVIPAVTALKQQPEYENARVMITGHSLGGALATMFALDWVLTFPREAPFVYTYGKPRIGNDKFSALYSSLVQNSFRLVHERDMIPHLPPLSGFVHSYTEVWLHNNTEIVCRKAPEDPNCSSSIYFTMNIQDHLTYFDIGMNSSCGNANAIKGQMDKSVSNIKLTKMELEDNTQKLE